MVVHIFRIILIARAGFFLISQSKLSSSNTKKSTGSVAITLAERDELSKNDTSTIAFQGPITFTGLTVKS